MNSPRSLEDKVALVTGAGGTMGRAVVRALLDDGCRVAMVDLHPASMDGLALEFGERVFAVTCDIGDQAAVRETHERVVQRFGAVDILINNAGILRDTPFDDLTPELLDPVIDVHLRGAVHVTRPAWHVMREQGYGRIVNTTSAAGILGTARKSNYGAAKAGLVGLTRVLAQEGAEHDIKVNAIAPIAATRMLTHSMAEPLEPAAQAMMNAVTSKLDPALVSPVVVFLAHEDCPVTGEIYTAGAGQVARFFTARTQGYHHPTLSIEDVRNHLADIRDETGYTVPASPGEEIAELLRAVAARP